VSEALASQSHGGGIDNGHQCRQPIVESSIEQALVAVREARQIDVSIQVGRAPVMHHHGSV